MNDRRNKAHLRGLHGMCWSDGDGDEPAAGWVEMLARCVSWNEATGVWWLMGFRTIVAEADASAVYNGFPLKEVLITDWPKALDAFLVFLFC